MEVPAALSFANFHIVMVAKGGIVVSSQTPKISLGVANTDTLTGEVSELPDHGSYWWPNGPPSDSNSARAALRALSRVGKYLYAELSSGFTTGSPSMVCAGRFAVNRAPVTLCGKLRLRWISAWTVSKI